MKPQKSPSEMSLEEAYKVLGVRPSSSVEQVQKAYKKLAKSVHPDVGGSDEEFKRVSFARGLILGSRRAKKSDIPFGKVMREYRVLRSMLPVGTVSESDLDEASALLYSRKEYRENEDRSEALSLARKMIVESGPGVEFLSSKASGKFRERSRAVLESDEKRMQRQLEFLQVREGAREARMNIADAIRRVLRFRPGKVQVPIVHRINGKKVVRYVVLSAALLSAIVAGAYVFSSKENAFRKASGYLEDKR